MNVPGLIRGWLERRRERRAQCEALSPPLYVTASPKLNMVPHAFRLSCEMAGRHDWHQASYQHQGIDRPVRVGWHERMTA